MYIAGQKPVLGKRPRDIIRRPHNIPMPIGLWLFNEGAGSRVNDLSGNGLTGDFAAGAASPSWGVGKFGSAILFDGGDKITVAPSKLSPLSANCSMMVWALTNSVNPNYECPFNYRTNADNDDLIGVFFNTTTELIHWWCGGDGGNSTSGGVWNVGQLHRFVITHDSMGNGKLYIDGVLVQSVADKTWVTATSPLMYFGDFVGGGLGPLDGQIELAALWGKTTLTASQIAQLCIGPFPWFRRDPIELWAAAALPVGAPGAMTLNTGYWGQVV